MTKGKLLIIYTRRARLHVKCAELHITFRRINAHLINVFKGTLAKFLPGNISSPE